MNEITNLDEFMENFPEANWLETRRGYDGQEYDRYSNGQGEGTVHESVWFCAECDTLVDDPWEEGCPECSNNG